MLTNDEIWSKWEFPRDLSYKDAVLKLCRNVEREAYKRAAAECRRLGNAPIWIASAYHCAEAIEALGREK